MVFGSNWWLNLQGKGAGFSFRVLGHGFGYLVLIPGFGFVTQLFRPICFCQGANGALSGPGCWCA